MPAPHSTDILFPTGAGDVDKILMHRITAATHMNESLVFLTVISSLRICCERFTVRLLRFMPETERQSLYRREWSIYHIGYIISDIIIYRSNID